MGKKMKLPDFLTTKQHSWRQWPSCNHPKTLSYRFNADEVFRTVNSVFFDPNDAIDTPDSWFTNSSESASFSTESDDGAESLETVVAGARSEHRLFFEPRGHTSSILTEKSNSGDVSNDISGAGAGTCTGDFFRPLRESVALAMESDDPYRDFRRSMEEMVEINGVKDWEGLEEMLGWYLRVNRKDNHGFIVGAFVDLLVELAPSSSSSSTDCNDHPSSTAVATTSTATATTSTASFSSVVSCVWGSDDQLTCCSRNEIDHVEEESHLTR